MVFGLLGKTLSHSHSPKIHSLFGNKNYSLFEMEESEVALFLQKREFLGINVTIPYKQAVMPLCDVIDGSAAEIGAVNTIVNCGGKLFGCNTDLDGFVFMCNRAGVDIRGKKVLILGSGGTSKTASAAARKLGALSIQTVSRSGEINYRNVYDKLADAEIIINTTPVGMYPNIGEKPIELSKFHHLSGVIDVIYNPLRTSLICEAQSLGIPCTGGLAMLVAQAAFSDTYFGGGKHSGARIVEVLNKTKASLENIVLIGMPGCGKSTVGKVLARRLGKELFDTDKLIVLREGKSIPEIFADKGEDYFRDRESEIVKELSSKSGVIIACGGGTILREENRVALHKNGKVFYIKRDLDKLASRGRPLSIEEGAIERLYEERAALYESFADAAVPPSDTVEESAFSIIKQIGAKR